jgi:hypothetical protein
LPVAPGLWFGPGVVQDEASDGRVWVRLGDDLARLLPCGWALPYRYTPRRHDTVWVVRDGEQAFVLGVARGRGRSELLFQGDAALRARGQLTLVADRGMRILGRVVALRADRLDVAVQALQERAERLTGVVKGLLTLRAGAVFRLVEGEDTVLASEISIQASESVRFDGGDVVAIS